MSEKEKFAPGLYYDLPREGAPEYVMGGITIDLDRFIPWAIDRAKSDPKLRLDCKRSQEGKGYAQINDWKPQAKAPPPSRPGRDVPQRPQQGRQVPQRQPDDDPIPF